MSSLLVPEHLLALLAVAVGCGLLCLVARSPGRGPSAAALLLGAVIVVAEAAWWFHLVRIAAWSPQLGLPLQLCDAAALVGAAALWTRRQTLVELAYFWACGGTVQALLTPDLAQRFPDPLYFQYYLAHGGVVAAALFLVVGSRQAPRPGAVLRVLALTAAFTGLVAVVDAATGANYMYLRQPPPAPTLLDALGPWPRYLFGAVALGVALLLVLDAPFRLGRRGASLEGPAEDRRAGAKGAEGAGPDVTVA